MLRYRDHATPLNWTMTALSSWMASTTKQNRIYQFFWKRFNQRRLLFLFAYSLNFFLPLTCSVMFLLLKSFCYISVFVFKWHFWWRQIWCHLHVTMLQCLAKFFNSLVDSNIQMIRAKNYEIASTFVKVIQRKLLASFLSGHSVYIGWHSWHPSNSIKEQTENTTEFTF